MSTARTVGLGAAIAVAAPLVVALGAIGWVLASFPPSQGERIRGPNELVGVEAGGSYAWVIPSASGVVLVDAGFDTSARALLREVGSRKVQAVLLTHAHADHVGGLEALPGVPVYTADAALLRGEREPGGWLARWFAQMSSLEAPPTDVRTVTDGEELRIDGIRVVAVTVPGHTEGSVAWLWDDVLFTGDAVLGGASPTLAPVAFADDPAQAEKSVSKLLPLDFDDLADGHVGLTGAARTALHRELGQKIEPPTVSVRVEGRTGDAIVERTGIYVEAPAPDVRGERPALVLLPDGPPLRVGEAGRPERAGWIGRTVTVRGRILGSAGGEGLEMSVEAIAPAEGGSAAGALPEVADRAALERHAGWWVRARGTVRTFAPLQAGARWGEGELALPDGTAVAFSAPVGPAAGQPWEGIARVIREEGRLRLAALPSGFSVDASRPVPQASP